MPSEGAGVNTLRQRPQGVYYLNVYFLVSFPQAKRVGNPSGKIPDKPEWQNGEIWMQCISAEAKAATAAF